jgi:hypothetical protein
MFVYAVHNKEKNHTDSTIISKGENTCKQGESQNELCKQLTRKDKQYQELLKTYDSIIINLKFQEKSDSVNSVLK